MDINLQLKMQEPINFQGIIIYQTKFNDILKYNVEDFKQLLLPYLLTLDSIGVPEDEQDKYNIFEDVIIRNEEISKYLIDSLKFFCKRKQILIEGNNIKIKENIIPRLINYFKVFYKSKRIPRKDVFLNFKDFILNVDNFDEFSDIILKIHAREKIKKERTPIFQNELQKDIWTKLQAGRARNANKDELRLEDLINTVQYGGKYYISNEQIRNFTLWEMTNAYRTILGISSYENNFSVFLVGGDKTCVEKHWTELIRIENKK